MSEEEDRAKLPLTASGTAEVPRALLQPLSAAGQHRAAPTEHPQVRAGLLLRAQHLLHPAPLPRPCCRAASTSDGDSEPPWGWSLPRRAKEGQGGGRWSSSLSSPSTGAFPRQEAVPPRVCPWPLHRCSQSDLDGAGDYAGGSDGAGSPAHTRGVLCLIQHQQKKKKKGFKEKKFSFICNLGCRACT